MEVTEAQYGAAMESLGSSSGSSTTNSFRSEFSLDVGYHPPMSEYEEIPSLRWLPASFFVPSKSTTASPSPRERDAVKARPRGDRSVFGVRRSNEVASLEVAHEQEFRELDLFQTHVANRLHSLVSNEDVGEQEQRGRPLVTLCFLRELMEAFVCIEKEFQALLVLLDRDPALVRRSPVGRLVADYLDRAVRSLDVCRAVDHALDSLGFCMTYAEIAASALRPAPVREDRFRRAKRALSNLLAFLIPDQDRHHGATKERPWLFGRSRSGAGASSGDEDHHVPAAPRYGRRCLSLSVSENWSAARQVEALLAGFAPPRGADATALSMAVYAMSAVMVLVVWTLVVAFPCQDQGGHGPSPVATAAARSLTPPWLAPWAAPMVSLRERIAEECRRERKGSPGSRELSPGLLAELQSLTRCGRAVVELGSGCPGFPLQERQQEEVADAGRELAATCRAMEEQLGPLQWQVREAFRRVSLSRVVVLGCLSHDGPEPLPVPRTD